MSFVCEVLLMQVKGLKREVWSVIFPVTSVIYAGQRAIDATDEDHRCCNEKYTESS